MAVAHSVLIIAYCLLRDNKPYTDLGGDYFEQRDAARIQRHHVQQLQHGVDLARLQLLFGPDAEGWAADLPPFEEWFEADDERYPVHPYVAFTEDLARGGAFDVDDDGLDPCRAPGLRRQNGGIWQTSNHPGGRSCRLRFRANAGG